MIVLIKLLLAHLIGDFVLQPDSWVRAKEKDKFKSFHLYVHSVVHGILIMLLMWDWTFWKWALIITCFHFAVDVVKLQLQTDKTKRAFFFIDQVLHLMLICLVWICYLGNGLSFEFLENEQAMAFIAALLFLTQPSSVIIKKFISKWTPEDGQGDSLQKAGSCIGVLERVFVFIFIIYDQWEAVGFLMAAKSVFRFGDLKEAHDRKLTEYVLIGTFASFGTAILVGILYLQLVK